MTCDEILAKSRKAPADEQALSAGESSYGPVLGFNSNGKVGTGVEVKTVQKPSKPGDRMALCAKGSLPIKNGPHTGKDLIAEGRLEGSFCGERK